MIIHMHYCIKVPSPSPDTVFSDSKYRSRYLNNTVPCRAVCDLVCQSIVFGTTNTIVQLIKSSVFGNLPLHGRRTIPNINQIFLGKLTLIALSISLPETWYTMWMIILYLSAKQQQDARCKQLIPKPHTVSAKDANLFCVFFSKNSWSFLFHLSKTIWSWLLASWLWPWWSQSSYVHIKQTDDQVSKVLLRLKSFFFFLTSSDEIHFLDAPSHLYKRVCPSIRRSVGPSGRRAVRP